MISLIDRSVRRVLALKFRLGLLENPCAEKSVAIALTNCDKHGRMAQESAERSIILLENRGNLLPLDRDRIKKVAVIGPHAKYLQFGGVSPHDRGISILDGIMALAGNGLSVEFFQGCALTDSDEDLAYFKETAEGGFADLRKAMMDGEGVRKPRTIPLAAERDVIGKAVACGSGSDVVVLCLGESQQCTGENYAPNRFGDRDDLDLIGNQMELLRAFKKTGVPFVLVLIPGRALAMGEACGLADAVLDCWNPGQARGTAIARILFGEVNPGGKLPVTVPVSVGHVPCHYGQKSLGYARDYAFNDTCEAYPFGFGLSYTAFAFSDIRLEGSVIRTGCPVRIGATITNTGNWPGDETVQVNLGRKNASVSLPARKFVAFHRVTVSAGSRLDVRLEIPFERFAHTDRSMVRKSYPGECTLFVGTSSRECTSLDLTISAEAG
jgi:beta-glucosidase